MKHLIILYLNPASLNLLQSIRLHPPPNPKKILCRPNGRHRFKDRFALKNPCHSQSCKLLHLLQKKNPREKINATFLQSAAFWLLLQKICLPKESKEKKTLTLYNFSLHLGPQNIQHILERNFNEKTLIFTRKIIFTMMAVGCQHSLT